MTTRTYWDFCSKGRWKFIIRWKLQSLLFPSVHFYWDKKQDCYCREVRNVKGEIRGEWFVPKKNLLVNYKQAI